MPEGKQGAAPLPATKKRWIGDYTGLIGSLIGIVTVIIGAYAYVSDIERDLTIRINGLESQVKADRAAFDGQLKASKQESLAEIDRVNRELCAHFTNRELDIAFQILDTVSATRETIDRIEFNALRPTLRKDLTEIDARLNDIENWLRNRPNSPTSTGVPKCESS